MTTTGDIRDILILCARRQGADDAVLEAGLRKAAALCSDMETELAALMPKNALPALAHVAEPSEHLPDVILTVRGDARSSSAALSDMVGALAPQSRTFSLVVQAERIPAVIV